MAPQKRRTPRIATGFDKSYTCTNPDCESNDLNRDTGLDDSTWRCKACGDPALIVMADDAGHTRHVRRCQAQDVEQDDYIYLDHDIDHVYRVLGSRKGTGQKNGDKWMLGLANHAGVYFAPDQYVNRV